MGLAASISFADVRVRRIEVRGAQCMWAPSGNRFTAYFILEGRLSAEALDQPDAMRVAAGQGAVILYPRGSARRLRTTEEDVCDRDLSFASGAVIGQGRKSAVLAEVQARPASAAGRRLFQVMPALMCATGLPAQNHAILALDELAAGDVAQRRTAALVFEAMYLLAQERIFDEFGASQLIARSMRCASVAKAISLMQMSPQVAWACAALAEHVGMSPSALARRFRKMVGVSPAKFLSEHRLTSARALMRVCELPVHEIAARVGYQSPSSFSAAFRRRFGLNPSDWRCANRNKRSKVLRGSRQTRV